jgi:cytochrome c2
MAGEDERAGTGSVEHEAGHRDVIRPPLRFYLMISSLFTIILLMVGYHYAVRGFWHEALVTSHEVPVADASRGRVLLREHGCIGCHTVPGVPGATGRVGPRLDRVREQSYIAGVLANSPQNLTTWIRRPQDIDPKTAMPNLGVTETDARDIAAYLYTLP